MPSTVFRSPGPDAKDQNTGEICSKGPGHITSMRWGQVLVLQSCRCTNPQTQIGEVTGLRAGPHAVAYKA